MLAPRDVHLGKELKCDVVVQKLSKSKVPFTTKIYCSTDAWPSLKEGEEGNFLLINFQEWAVRE